MGMPALQIGQMRNRYRVCEGDNGDGYQQQLDRMVSDRLPGVLDRHIGGLYQRLGFNGDCLVAVRKLNIRIELAGFSAAAERGLIDHIAESWGKALLSGLERILSTTGLTPGQAIVTDTLAVFPSLASARRHWIRQLVRNAAQPWWSRVLPGADGDARALPQHLIDLASSDPKSAAQCVVELADDPGPAWLASLDRSHRVAVASTLIAAATIEGGAMEENGDRRGESALLNSLSATQQGQLGRCADGGSATLLYVAIQLLQGRPIMAGHELLKCRLETLLALAQGRGVERPAEAGRKGTTPEVEIVMDTEPAHPESLEYPLAYTPMSMDAETERAGVPDSSTADAIDPMMTATFGVPVGCGGLLFLIRFASRRWEQDTNVNQAMLALGVLVLNSVFDRLSPAARRAAWRRDAGLLQVFAGLREPLGEVDELHHPDAALGWARGVIETIVDRIDDDVGPAPRGSEYVLGHADEPLSALDRLLLRPGRLRVTENEAKLILPADGVDIGLRRGAWDSDPGWVPQLGRIIRFEYRDQ